MNITEHKPDFRERWHDGSPSEQLLVTRRAWRAMWARCIRTDQPKSASYRKRGIAVCKQWRSFLFFLRDVGLRPSPKHSVERSDNDRGYEPGNVEWATMLVQQNNRSNNRRWTHDGESRTLSEWSRLTGIPIGTLANRCYAKGMSLSEAISAPTRKTRRYRFRGRERTLSEWSVVVEIPLATLKWRTRKGWPIARVLTEVVR